MTRWLSLSIAFLLLIATPLLAQSDRLTYTEEFAGGSLEPYNIGETGWNFEGSGKLQRSDFSGVTRVKSSGFVDVLLPEGPPSWGALVFGTLVGGIDGASTIPIGLNNETWSAQWTFGGSPRGTLSAGLFIPNTMTAPNFQGCYVRQTNFEAFTYVCEGSAGRVEVDTGVIPAIGGIYTLRMQGQSAGQVRMSLTRLSGVSTAENLASVRFFSDANLFRSGFLVPAFIISGEAGSDVFADYFHFDLQKVRR